MQLYHVTNIIWDLDEDDDTADEGAEALGLPSSAYVYASDEDAVTDVLSDKLGWCIRTLDVDALDPETPMVFAD